jgi:biopolymer transport protein ExbD
MRARRRTYTCEVPAVAMGDIAFLLLIFFVILAKAQDDSHLRWDPATTDKLEEAGHPRASVAVDVDNKLYLNGQPIAIGQLEGRLNDILAKAAPDDRKVHLKIDREAMASRFEPIIEAASRAGAKIVHVLEEEIPADK